MPSFDELNQEFNFFSNTKGSILVVTLQGVLTAQDEERFREMQEEILGAAARFVILNFHDLVSFDRRMHRDFIQLQKMIRDLPADLYLCHFRPAVGQALEEAGALRTFEVKRDLITTLQNIIAGVKR